MQQPKSESYVAKRVVVCHLLFKFNFDNATFTLKNRSENSLNFLSVVLGKDGENRPESSCGK